MNKAKILLLFEILIDMEPYVGKSYMNALLRILKLSILKCKDELPCFVNRVSGMTLEGISRNLDIIKEDYTNYINEQTK